MVRTRQRVTTLTAGKRIHLESRLVFLEEGQFSSKAAAEDGLAPEQHYGTKNILPINGRQAFPAKTAPLGAIFAIAVAPFVGMITDDGKLKVNELHKLFLNLRNFALPILVFETGAAHRGILSGDNF